MVCSTWNQPKIDPIYKSGLYIDGCHCIQLPFFQCPPNAMWQMCTSCLPSPPCANVSVTILPLSGSSKSSQIFANLLRLRTFRFAQQNFLKEEWSLESSAVAAVTANALSLLVSSDFQRGERREWREQRKESGWWPWRVNAAAAVYPLRPCLLLMILNRPRVSSAKFGWYGRSTQATPLDLDFSHVHRAWGYFSSSASHYNRGELLSEDGWLLPTAVWGRERGRVVARGSSLCSLARPLSLF